MPLHKAKCSLCGETLRARARDTLMSKLSKHMWKNHREAMRRRIKAGLKKTEIHNPLVQDFLNSLKTAPANAVRQYKRMATRQRRHIDRTMIQLRPYLPPEINIAWEVTKAVLDPILFEAD